VWWGDCQSDLRLTVTENKKYFEKIEKMKNTRGYI
jgi:hypothetical protein